MKEPDRIDRMCRILKNVWKANPNLRLGQIIVNASQERPYNYPDDAMMQGLQILAEMKVGRSNRVPCVSCRNKPSLRDGCLMCLGAGKIAL